MKKQLISFGLATVLALAASPSFATGKHHPKFHVKDKVCYFLPFLCAKPNKPKDKPPAHSVPEIDAANAGLALALIGGIVAIRRERRNRR